ncbi:MAG: hypothetical protein QOG49_450 [Frankiaceae bacterium]|nr:hypothetical protein [Frankiaceae bacterium]
MAALGTARFAPAQPQLQQRRGGGRLLVVVAVIASLLAVGALKMPNWFPHAKNPLTTKTVDRTAPPVLKALEDLHEYRASTGHFEVIVDVEKDAKYFPSFIKGERTLFVAAGSVDGVVDFTRITPAAVTMSPDRLSVALALPHARLGAVRIDPAGSYVYEQKRGALDRIGDVFSSNPGGEQEFYKLAEAKMVTAAQGTDGIVARAETNTTAMLTSLLQSLGFTSISISYADPTATSSAP